MKKSGIISLIVGGAALIGAGIVTAISKSKECDLDVTNDETIDYDYDTEETEA